MKTLNLIALAVFATVIVGNQALAQNTSIRMTIPFTFSVSNQPFPAGDYLFIANGHLLQVKNVDGSANCPRFDNLCRRRAARESDAEGDPSSVRRFLILV